MTTAECDRHMNASSEYNCTDTFCNGNDCGYCYMEQPLCEDIAYEYQTEGRCMTIEDCERYMTDSKGKTCNTELFKDNDYVYKYKEQT